MLLEESIDLIRSPEVVVDLSSLGLSYCREFNCGLLALSCGEAESETHSSRCLA